MEENSNNNIEKDNGLDKRVDDVKSELDKKTDNEKVKLDKKTLFVLVIIIIGAIILATLGMIDSIKSIIEVHQEDGSSYVKENSSEIEKIYSEIKK